MDITPKEAIILAGGKGTRLQSISANLPKPMMPVCGKPFLKYLLHKLLSTGLQRAILSVGYKHEIIRSYFGDNFEGMRLDYCVEATPLGTGGALAEAIRLTDVDNLLVLNGDSYYNINLLALFKYHLEFDGDLTIALKQLADCARFGTVTVQAGRVIAFKEKVFSGCGFMNSGIYAINRRILCTLPIGRTYSFETDILTTIAATHRILPYHTDGYFIDIGTPDDYQRAQKEFSAFMGTVE